MRRVFHQRVPDIAPNGPLFRKFTLKGSAKKKSRLRRPDKEILFIDPQAALTVFCQSAKNAKLKIKEIRAANGHFGLDARADVSRLHASSGSASATTRV